MFISKHKDIFGVEPVCRVLTASGWQIAPGTYYAAVRRPPPARAVRDAQILAEIRRMRADYEEVYGARKTWLELNRRQIPVARCTVERIMRENGLRGVRRGRKVRTTIPGKGPGHERAPDLINRDFTAEAPNRRWVADFTQVATLAGTVYVAFAVDIFSRMIVGWAAARHKRAKLVLDALDMALWHRDRAGRRPGPGLVHHSDAGSQYTCIAFTAHLAAEGVVPSIGTVGDALDKPRVAYCTSSERLMARWRSCRSDGVVSASLVAGWWVGSGRVVEDLAFVVIPVPTDNSGVVPDFDGAWGHAELLGRLRVPCRRGPARSSARLSGAASRRYRPG